MRDSNPQAVSDQRFSRPPDYQLSQLGINGRRNWIYTNKVVIPTFPLLYVTILYNPIIQDELSYYPHPALQGHARYYVNILRNGAGLRTRTADPLLVRQVL